MLDATFAASDLTTFARLDEFGLARSGSLWNRSAVLACRVVERDQWCRRCGCQGTARDSVTRALAHEPLGWRPTTLLVMVRRYQCCECGHVWRQDTSRAAQPRAKLSRDGTGPARLLDMVEGRFKSAFQSWLAARPDPWRQEVQDVAMDGFTGFKTATTAELPHATAVMDPFHVVRLAGDALDHCRRRVQQDTHGLFALDEHVQVEATWGIYQRMIAAYRHPDRAKGRRLMTSLIDSLSRGVPAALTELITLGRTLTKRASNVLAYFDRPGTTNGSTEAINGRLEHLRGSALGFRNLTNYIARGLLETGRLQIPLHPRSR